MADPIVVKMPPIPPERARKALDHNHRWHKADKPGPCEVCGSTTWALSTTSMASVRRCMMHGPLTVTAHATRLLSAMLATKLEPIARPKIVLYPLL